MLACVPALADMRPRLVPARDVTIEYSVQPAGRQAVDVRVEILAGGQHLRITSPDLPTTMLVDRNQETAAILVPFLRAYSDVKIARYDPERTLLAGAAFRREGRDHLVGHDCTEWHAHAAQADATACVTGDGIILSGSAVLAHKGPVGSVRALRVAYGAPPPALFAVPKGFRESPIRLDGMDDGR